MTATTDAAYAALRLVYLLKESKKKSLKFDVHTYKMIVGDTRPKRFYSSKHFNEVVRWVGDYDAHLQVHNDDKGGLSFILCLLPTKGFKISAETVKQKLKGVNSNTICKYLDPYRARTFVFVGNKGDGE
jgi:hypothetical protein